MCQLKHADCQRVLQNLSLKETWKDQTFRRRWHESTRESAIYDRLKKGPVFKRAVEHTILREALVENIRQLIIPAEEDGLYPLIVGEYGTGKTSLIKLTVNGMAEPKGIVYADMADDEADIAQVMREAVGWSPDPLIDSSQRNCCSSLLVLLKANRFAAASLHEVLRVFPVSPSSISKSMGDCQS
jgi:hypothetical protein